MRNLYLNAILLLFFVVTNSCSDQRHFIEIEYKGIVYDATQLTPVKNCLVELEAKKPYTFWNGVQYFEIRRTYTKDDGSFEIQDRAARSNLYRISFHKQDFQSLTVKDVKSKDFKSGKYSIVYLNPI